MSDYPLIYCKDLEKIYGEGDARTYALRGISFEIKKGEFVAIMGPSGSGKSTLLHIIGFLDKPTNGEFRFNGKLFEDYSSEEIAQIRNQKLGFVFQMFNLLPRTTVYDNVRLALLYSPIPEKEWDRMVRKAIESVGLTHRIDHEPSELSGGERQRVAIARALVNEPDVIFADEPTGNLDSVAGQKVMEILQDLNTKEGHTIILITHEEETAEFAERMLFMRDGQLERDEPIKKRRTASDGYKK